MAGTRDERQMFRNLFYPERMRNIDIDAWVAHCASLGATGVCLDIKSQIYALYPSSWLEKDPLAGERDFAAELSESARRHGLFWCAYIAPYQQEELRDSHRHWQQCLEDGTLPGEAGTGFLKTQFCWNSGYRDLLCNVLREIAERYKPDSFYIDGMRFYSSKQQLACYCDACQARFREEYGAALPLMREGAGRAEHLRLWRLFLAARTRWLSEAAAALRSAVDEVSPGIILYLNNKFGSDNWTSSHSPAQFRGFVPCRELIPQVVRGGLPYAPFGFSAGDLFLWNCATQRALARGKSGQLYFSFSPVMGAADIQLSFDLAASAGASITFQECRRDTAAQMARLQDFTQHRPEDAIPVAEVAIHYSYAALRLAAPVLAGIPFRNDAATLYKMMLDLHRPAEVVLDEDLADGNFRNASLVMLPESDCMNSAAREKISAYIESGGVVLASLSAGTLDEDGCRVNGGELLFPGSGLFPGEKAAVRQPFGLRREGDGSFLREEPVGANPAQYLEFHQGSTGDWLGEDMIVKDHPGSYEERELFALRDSPSVYLPEPANLVRADERWDVLASLRFHDDETGVWKEVPAILARKVGRGTLLYTSFSPGSLFRERSLWSDIGYTWSRNIVAHLVEMAIGKSPFQIKAPACAKFTFWRSGKYTLVYVINELSGHHPVIGLEERLPIEGCISVSTAKFSDVRVLSGGDDNCRVTNSPHEWNVAFHGLKDRLLLQFEAVTQPGGT